MFFTGQIIVTMYLCTAEKSYLLGTPLFNETVSWVHQELYLLFMLTRSAVLQSDSLDHSYTSARRFTLFKTAWPQSKIGF